MHMLTDRIYSNKIFLMKICPNNLLEITLAVHMSENMSDRGVLAH